MRSGFERIGFHVNRGGRFVVGRRGQHTVHIRLDCTGAHRAGATVLQDFRRNKGRFPGIDRGFAVGNRDAGRIRVGHGRFAQQNMVNIQRTVFRCLGQPDAGQLDGVFRYGCLELTVCFLD